MDKVSIGALEVSRFIIGSNPMSGFSHQSGEMDARMRHYFTTQQIKRLLGDAEALGINTVIARADHHVMRLLMEYWDEGGKMQWIAQTCPELGTIERAVQNAISGSSARERRTGRGGAGGRYDATGGNARRSRRPQS
jgi:hypothetical protein